MIRPAQFDFLDTYGIITNTDWSLSICLRDAEGDVMDLTTWEGRMEVKDKSGNTIIMFDSTLGTMVLGDTDPNILLTADINQTNVTPGLHSYDLRLLNDDDKQYIYLRGRFDILKNLTSAIT
jgi:hypothetical protein